MKIKFWGTRGSIPTPSTANFVTSRFGGNTTCLSVHVPGRMLILDGGSGLRNLGLELAREKSLHATFLFSHVHWDHIQGFPFFLPGFERGNTFDLYGRCLPGLSGFAGSTVANALLQQQQSQNFPVRLEEMGAQLNFYRIQAGDTLELAAGAATLTVTAGELNHPGGCFGYRIEERTGKGVKTFAFATDTEHLEQNNPQMQALARDADVLAYDAQYTLEEYEGSQSRGRRSWGHSTWFHGLREAAEARVKHLLLTHHDPLHDDRAVARIEKEARKAGLKQGLDVEAACEGMEVEL